MNLNDSVYCVLVSLLRVIKSSIDEPNERYFGVHCTFIVNPIIVLELIRKTIRKYLMEKKLRSGESLTAKYTFY